MTKEQKHELLKKAYVYRDSNGKYYINDEALSIAERDTILDLQIAYKENYNLSYDLSYELMAKACEFIGDCTIEALEAMHNTGTEFNNDFASVYTGVRLSYLTVNNQYDISEIYKETECEDIATACAIWYDRAVETIASDLINGYIFA